MSAGSESLQGPRLAFVARKLEGTIVRPVYSPPPTRAEREKNPKLANKSENTVKQVIEPAGWMVYMPSGNCYRMSNEELIRRKFDQEPDIIGFDQANNRETPVGRYKFARTEAAKQKAWKEMEEQVVKSCQGRFGSVLAMISDYNPKGKVPNETDPLAGLVPDDEENAE